MSRHAGMTTRLRARPPVDEGIMLEALRRAHQSALRDEIDQLREEVRRLRSEWAVSVARGRPFAAAVQRTRKVGLVPTVRLARDVSAAGAPGR